MPLYGSSIEAWKYCLGLKLDFSVDFNSDFYWEIAILWVECDIFYDQFRL